MEKILYIPGLVLGYVVGKLIERLFDTPAPKKQIKVHVAQPDLGTRMPAAPHKHVWDSDLGVWQKDGWRSPSLYTDSLITLWCREPGCMQRLTVKGRVV